MKKNIFLKLTLAMTLACIFLPLVLLAVWSVTERWPWPGLLPESLSLRTIRDCDLHDERVKDLADKLLKTEEANIKEMKKLRKVFEYKVKNETNVESFIICRNNFFVVFFKITISPYLHTFVIHCSITIEK